MRIDASVVDKSCMLTRLLAASIPVAFGVASIAIGQDANWDLRNYHLYNAWAFLHHRVDVDLAPAGLATYFNPLLDLPYYWMAGHLPARVTAFIMGTVHGLNFLLLYRIGHHILAGTESRRTVALIALAGCAGSIFLSELGNTMGDNLTAVAILSALAIALKATCARADGAQPRFAFLAAGLVAGLGIGLKLTNAPYGLGLLAGVVALGGSWHVRRAQLVALSAGLGVGVTITGGYWFATMWRIFGNPLFPQFNSLFGAPLAGPLSLDQRWLPKSLVEGFLFPYAFTLFPMRVSEIPMVQVLWPVVYTLFLTWLVIQGVRFSTRSRDLRTPTPIDDASRGFRFLLAFAALGYLVWMGVFSIGRYTVVLELLLPLLLWVLLQRMFRPTIARKTGTVLVTAAAILSICGFRTWGNADWGEREPFTVDVPRIAHPESATVLVLATPIAWILPHFPEQLVHLSFNTAFPESAAYRERVRRIIAARGGEVLAIVPAAEATQTTGLLGLNRWLASHEIRKDDLLCTLAQRILANAPFADLVFDEGDRPVLPRAPCRFKRDPTLHWGEHADNRRIAVATSASIEDRGMSIDIGSCSLHSAFIGASKFEYQFCRVVQK